MEFSSFSFPLIHPGGQAAIPFSFSHFLGPSLFNSMIGPERRKGKGQRLGCPLTAKRHLMR
jgi:hypothetical protein